MRLVKVIKFESEQDLEYQLQKWFNENNGARGVEIIPTYGLFVIILYHDPLPE